MMKLIEQVWGPNAPSNADWYCVGHDFACILDGAANLGKSKMPNFENDAVWLVRRLADELSNLTGKEKQSAIMLVEEIRLRLLQEYSDTPDETEESPFACLGIVREIEGYIEFLNMGDLTFLIEKADGQILQLGHNQVRRLDNEVLSLLKAEIKLGKNPHSERMKSIWPRILHNRSLRNVLQGYEVFDPNFSCLAKFERNVLCRNDVKYILMVTDGFYRCVDVFGMMTPEHVLLQAKRKNLHNILDEIRALESKDEECIIHPRFKKSDDATAIMMEIE